jgi:D-arabinose 1-dehydrogenase-like Zn-dependent alcohol dehydrogenase
VTRARLVQLGWDAPLAVERAARDPLERGQVRVAVEACGVCHRDLLDREGRFPFVRVPITPGHEAAGRVVEVGADVRDWAVGDRVATMHRDACGECATCRRGETSLCEAAGHVFGLLADGGYASELVAPQSALYAIPGELPAGHAAVLHCTFGTVYRDLVTLGGLSAGQRVLVTGANGGCGSAAVQVAARIGAHVVAVIRDERHAAFVRELGAHDVVVDGTSPAMPERGRNLGDEARFGERGEPVDLALDTVGAPTFLAALRAVRVGGRVVVIGNVTREKVPVNLGFLITRGITVVGGSGATRAEMRAVLAMHAASPFRFVVRPMPLSRADEAQRLVRTGGLEGRIVLVPDGTSPASPERGRDLKEGRGS